jgi:ABC-type transporter Mla MlaB component
LFRITIQESSDPATVKLEGKLAGPWVKELARIWRAMDAGKAILIDLCGVSFVDPSGRDLLAQMYQGGADFVADTPLMKQVVHEVTTGSNGCGVANATVLELLMPKGAKG